MARPEPTPAERIYAVIRSIPPGRVATYGQVAALAGLPGHARQVGQALRETPEGREIPWQRVINAKGEVSPRGGLGLEEGLQRHLLQEEGVVFDDRGRINLGRFGWDPDTRPPRKKAGGAGSAYVHEIEAILRPLGTAERAQSEKRYLKSDLDFLGITVPALRKAARSWLKSHPDLDHAVLLNLVRSLWDKPIHELRVFAIELLTARSRALRSEDLDLLEDFLRRSKTWAYVDVIAIHLVGSLIEADPKQARRLDRWIKDPDFWIRRSALLALLLPLRHGEGDWERFVRYADRLLEEREFFIRKAIGWVLREVSKQRPELVREFLRERGGRVSGVTQREASKNLRQNYF